MQQGKILCSSWQGWGLSRLAHRLAESNWMDVPMGEGALPVCRGHIASGPYVLSHRNSGRDEKMGNHKEQSNATPLWGPWMAAKGNLPGKHGTQRDL